MPGNIICLLALCSCIPMVLYCFSKFRPESAVILSFFGALMFLPMAELHIPLILYTKMTATAIGVLIAIKIYDPEKLEDAALHPVDIPMVCWCLSGFIASVANGLGPKDGLQEAFNTFTLWGIPYLAGRLYFSNPEGLALLCRCLFAAGLIYIPFVLFELKMSPQSHRIVYGYMQHDFSQVIRGGGYRPMVFMEHGIMLGTWMSMGALVGLWCVMTKAFPRKMWRAPTLLLAVALAATAVACKSSGALMLLFTGLSVLFLSWKLRTGLLVWVLLMIPVVYVGTRATGYWDGQNLVDVIAEKYSADRAESLRFRFENENMLVAKALERPIFGWGGWGRSRVYDEDSMEDKSVTDGFWIIALGTRGYFGLVSVTLVLMLPTVLLLVMCPARFWGNAEYAPTAVISLIPLLFMIDCLPNAMINQAYIIFAGGASGLLAKYGIAGLTGRGASGADAAAGRAVRYRGGLPTPRRLGVSHLALPEKGRESPDADARAEARPVPSAAGAGTRIGLAEVNGRDSGPSASHRNLEAGGPAGADLKMAPRAQQESRAPARGGPRILQSPFTIMAGPRPRGLAVLETQAPPAGRSGDPGELPRAGGRTEKNTRDEPHDK